MVHFLAGAFNKTINIMVALTLLLQSGFSPAVNVRNETKRAAPIGGVNKQADGYECDLYPIALSGQTLDDVQIGEELSNILAGTEPGNFGWLAWNGSPSEPTLVASLTQPGNSDTYVDPDEPNDHTVSPGDWVS